MHVQNSCLHIQQAQNNINFQLYAGFVFYRRNVKKSVEPTGLRIEKGNPPTYIYSICPSFKGR
jgi:hypothetical protein